MIDLNLFWFSFTNGALAFFAPCAVALLPGYLAALLAKHKSASKTGVIANALLLAALTIAGIAIMYLLGGILIFTVASLVKKYLVYIVIGMGILVILMGVAMVLGKQVSIPIHGPNATRKSQYTEAFIFGIAYGLGALGCLFPLFLVVATGALNAPNVVLTSVYFLAYAAGMSLFMLLFYIGVVVAQKYTQRVLTRIMPYVIRIAGVLVILAGLYVIYYQSALL